MKTKTLLMASSLVIAGLALSSCDSAKEINFSVNKYSTAVTSDDFVTKINEQITKFNESNDALKTGFSYKSEKFEKSQEGYNGTIETVAFDSSNSILKYKEDITLNIKSASEKECGQATLQSIYYCSENTIYEINPDLCTYELNEYDSADLAKEKLEKKASNYNTLSEVNIITIGIITLGGTPLYYIDGNTYTITTSKTTDSETINNYYQLVFNSNSYTLTTTSETTKNTDNSKKTTGQKYTVTVKAQKLKVDISKYYNEEDVPEVDGID